MESDIAKWFSGQHILVTGATGFMGKILVEKLLRSCPGISKIYLLIRPRKGKDPNRRIEDFVNNAIFDKIRDSSDGEKLFLKLYLVSGDVSLHNLNLSNDDCQTLLDNVTVVFHMAANVRFDQSLKSALLANTRGTQRVLDLACSFRKLIAFVHVSTTYCHCSETRLLEKTYAAPHDPKKILELVSWMDDSILEKVTPQLIKNAPNTYAYTKCLTEQLVSDYSKKLPVAIARPSIVAPAWKEPLAGWVDNLNGPTGLMVGAGKGVVRTIHCDPELEADLIPVDVAINNIIVVGYTLGSSPRSNDVQVYHITSQLEKRIKWGDALNLTKKHFYNNPFSVCLWYPRGDITSSYIQHTIAAFFLHLLPAYFIDFLMILTGNKTFLVRTQQRISKGLEALQYYTTRPWYFHTDNMVRIRNALSKYDNNLFYTNTNIDYDQYFLSCVHGARKYCIHEEPDTLPYARKLLKRLYYLDILKNIVLGCLLIWFVSSYFMAVFSVGRPSHL